MSLDDLIPDDVGDGKGGRPTEDRKETRTVHGDPYTQEKDTEEWWQEKWDRFVGLGEPKEEDITVLSDHVALRPSTVMQKVTEHDVYEFDQEDVKEDYPLDMKEGHWSGGGKSYADFRGTDDSTEEDEDTERSGLLGLVDDAKRQDDD